MVPKWKRLLLSLTGFVLAVAICCFLLSIRGGIGNPPDPKGLLQLFCYESIMMLWFSLPGWVLALPAILLFTDLRAWRFWALLALGAGIGPFTLYLEFMYVHYSSAGDKLYLSLAAAVSSLSTLIYLFLLRRSQGLEHRSSH
jgi:hypothetical protein